MRSEIHNLQLHLSFSFHVQYKTARKENGNLQIFSKASLPFHPNSLFFFCKLFVNLYYYPQHEDKTVCFLGKPIYQKRKKKKSKIKSAQTKVSNRKDGKTIWKQYLLYTRSQYNYLKKTLSAILRTRLNYIKKSYLTEPVDNFKYQ